MAIARQSEQLEVARGSSVGDLGRDALWFAVHTLLALLFLGIVWGVITLSQPDPESNSPKVYATALAFLVPLISGFLIARARSARRETKIARYVWISGVLLFAAVCVWVLDLPTGPGLCEACGPVEKLWRTFFSINHGSGLMGGDGLLIGAWAPLSLLGYAAGAAIGLEV